MNIYRLRNHDMKTLVCVLRGIPHEAMDDERAEYRKHTQERIRNLSHHLRSSHLSLRPTNLCITHKGLDSHLINSIWGWLRYEFENGLGKFLYPIIISGRLTADQELKVRQLEPVLQMWRTDFNLHGSAPLGHGPIQCGSTWTFQEFPCPACILARIGSDEEVLFALFAGMVGRFHTRPSTATDVRRSIVPWEKTRSKRVRFVRYWLCKTRGGDVIVDEAGALGMKMKRLRQEWSDEQCSLDDQGHTQHTRLNFNVATAGGAFVRDSYFGRYGTGRRKSTADTDRNRQIALGQLSSTVSNIDSNVTEANKSRNWPLLCAYDTKIGPEPRTNDEKRESPARPLDFPTFELVECPPTTTFAVHQLCPILKQTSSEVTFPTVHPEANASRAAFRDLPPQTPKAPQAAVQPCTATLTLRKRKDSLLDDSSSIYSPSTQHTKASKIHQPSVFSLRTILSYDGNRSSLSIPSMTSLHNMRTDPLDSPIYNPILTHEKCVQMYRDLLAMHPDEYVDPFGDESEVASTLPPPQRTSMYSSFGN